ncbi:MAG: hypothetical protein MUC97_13430 [Bernardetiaceae bacterium]|nr:hypothetical protein [Bernardetiaceae bacterium]
MPSPALSSPVLRPRLFQGAPDSPFLAPRGVWWQGGWLLVADTGQNRVFGWRGLPTTALAPPDLVLGQTETGATGRNAGGRVGAASLQYPSGLWTDGQRLAVADAWNHRVLLWHQLPQRPGAPADVVLGQPDFTHNEPNVAGVGKPPSAQSLYWPYGVHFDGERLWIADTGNRRVVGHSQWPQAHFSPADLLIGKPSFTERDYEHTAAVWPYSVKLGPGGELAIADTQYCRVLWWLHWQAALAGEPPRLIGQPDLASNGPNQLALRPGPAGLNWCYDTAFWRGRLWVADTANSRVLAFALGNDPLPKVRCTGRLPCARRARP